MTVRLKDVARASGVSVATVSRALADKPHVRPEVKRRVHEVARQLGYRPNRLARSLREQRSRILGVIIADIQNPFCTALVRAVEDVAYAHGYAVFLCNADENEEKEQLYVDLMQAERVAGVVISPTSETASGCAQLLAAGVPVVAVDRRVSGLELDTVVIDNVAASFELVNRLIERGLKRIAAILPLRTITTGRERFEGYAKALEHAGLPVDCTLVHHGQPVEAMGYSLMRELLRLAPPPEGVFTGNNVLTAGALRALREADLKIPEDIEIVAFDDLDGLSLVPPELAAVSQPVYELGRVAASLLLERIHDPQRAAQEVVLQSELRVTHVAREVR